MMPTWRKLGYIEGIVDLRVLRNQEAVGRGNEEWEEVTFISVRNYVCITLTLMFLSDIIANSHFNTSGRCDFAFRIITIL